MSVIGVNDFDISVCCISFSKSDGGSLLVAVDDAPDHTISVWDWQKGEHGSKIAETKVSWTSQFLEKFTFQLSVFGGYCSSS